MNPTQSTQSICTPSRAPREFKAKIAKDSLDPMEPMTP